MAKHSQRVFTLIIVIVFLLSTVAFTGLVLWQMYQDDSNGEGNEITLENQEGNSLEGTLLEDYQPVDNVDELETIDLVEGDGEEVQPGDTVVAHYTGAEADSGLIFQSSHDRGEPVPFSLDGVIQGWTEGVPGMKVGGKRRLIIPADKAYGATPPPNSNIAPNSALVFDIELVGIE